MKDRKRQKTEKAERNVETTAGSDKTMTRTLLKLVRAAQPISRAELARRLGCNRSTVTGAVRPLIESGVLTETSQLITRTVGRPPIGLRLYAEGSLLIGANIGVRQTQVGIARVDGTILREEAFDTPNDPLKELNEISESIKQLRAHFAEHKIEAIGISVPGPVDPERRTLLYAPHLGWQDVEIAAALRFHPSRASKSLVPVIVENDATAAAMFEASRRLKDDKSGIWRDFILVRAGTGIGIGVVRDGEIYRGVGASGNLAGEFGHMTIVAGGKLCVCGNRGCWERYASATSAVALYLGDRAPTSGPPPIRYAEIVRRAEAGEIRAQRTLEQTGEYLGIGIANVISGLGIDRVVVSGRIVLGWQFIREPLQMAVRRALAGRLVDPIIEAGLVTGSGLGGAMEVAIDYYLTHVAEQTKSG
ncbi:ROK family transcriptional regulator [Pyrinomonas methylaliphatogenes]|uniref:Transcriptional regulator/sugar kinase n=1 Tax=Pyrinomonas methylaliphatogenes TaxID=454194 RepID=A0A0B6WZ65_9BACT|nr:ROK family transcriptional regulator [Pyrinomonas methylaliphatogenes]CDM66548.1 transcriptional regulator/sugar kinase [Pyrinomonas methylaliphatogenes]